MRLASATKRLVEEKIYEKVVQELAQGHRRDGLWAKALAVSNGVDEKAKALYIQYRVQSIRDEAELLKANDEEIEQQVKTNQSKNNKSNSSQDKIETYKKARKLLHNKEIQHAVNLFKAVIQGYPDSHEAKLSLDILKDIL